MLKKLSLGLATLGASAAGAYALFIRPWHLHWGATDEEVHRPLPGDAWIPYPKLETTRAITIQARPADVWSWLVQMGTGRAGRYSYAWLENLLPRSAVGAGITNAQQILPEFQHLQVGDSIPLSPTTGLTVAALAPPHVLALRVTMSALSGKPLAPDEPKPDAWLDGSWVFVLEALDEHTTRLIERVRADYQPHLRLASLVYLLVEPVFFVMERKMLLGMKQRAEKGTNLQMGQRSRRRTPSSWSVILRQLGGTRLRVWGIKHVVSPPDRWLYQCTAGRQVTLGRPLIPLVRLPTTGCRTGRALSQAARAWGWLSISPFPTVPS